MSFAFAPASTVDFTGFLCDLVGIEDRREPITAEQFNALAAQQTTEIANSTDAGSDPHAEEGIHCLVIERLRGQYRIV